LKTKKNTAKTFLVLVPHRDTRLVLRKYSDSLFKSGFPGAYSFPWVVPLAAISRSLSEDELKHCARALREAALFLEKGKISAPETSCISINMNKELDANVELSTNDELSANMKSGVHNNSEGILFGPCLDLSLPPNAFNESAAKKIIALFSPLVIGSCLLPTDKVDTAALPPAPQISFRAAAVANMKWRSLQITARSYGVARPDSGIGYKWKIGKLCWLPAVRKKA
jgi:hypothetical protein